MRSELMGFAVTVMGPDALNAEPMFLTPDEAMEVVWAINDMLLPQRRSIDAVPHTRSGFNECDDAILAFGLDPSARTFQRLLTPHGWRSLQDRHMGFLTVAAANKAAGNDQFIVLPKGMARRHWLPAILISHYFRFPRAHLPTPVLDDRPAPKARRRQSEKRVGGTATREETRPTVAETSPPTPPPDYQAAVQVMREATMDRRIKSGLRRWVSRLLMTAGALFLIFVALGLAGAWDPPAR